MNETADAFAERTIRSLKKKFSIKWEILDTSTFRNCLISSQPLLPDKLLDRLDTKKRHDF